MTVKYEELGGMTDLELDQMAKETMLTYGLNYKQALEHVIKDYKNHHIHEKNYTLEKMAEESKQEKVLKVYSEISNYKTNKHKNINAREIITALENIEKQGLNCSLVALEKQYNIEAIIKEGEYNA